MPLEIDRMFCDNNCKEFKISAQTARELLLFGYYNFDNDFRKRIL
jgi:hypothetical protein